MAKPYQIQVTNGVGEVTAVKGTYEVSTAVTGYDTSSILPETLTIDDNTTTLSFTVAATGQLTVHVSETGLAGGTAVSNAVFYRTDASGSNNYGEARTSGNDGTLLFNNVPYDSDNPVNIYIRQTASDGNHDFSDEVISVIMNSATVTHEVMNPLPKTYQVSYSDVNYGELPITGTINLA